MSETTATVTDPAEMARIVIDPALIVGPMAAHRESLLAEADKADALAAQARAEARRVAENAHAEGEKIAAQAYAEAQAAAERAIRNGEQLAEEHDQAAATSRAYAEYWSGAIAREQYAATAAAAAAGTDDGRDGWPPR